MAYTDRERECESSVRVFINIPKTHKMNAKIKAETATAKSHAQMTLKQCSQNVCRYRRVRGTWVLVFSMRAILSCAIHCKCVCVLRRMLCSVCAV